MVRCRCGRCLKKPKYYVGETGDCIMVRFWNGRCLTATTELAKHFRFHHPGKVMKNNIQIYMVLDEISVRSERVAKQNELIRKLKAAHLDVLNKIY